MKKLIVVVLSISFAGSIIEISLGFATGNLNDTSMCSVFLVVGTYGWLYGLVITSISSVVCISMSLLIVAKLIHRKRDRNFYTTSGSTNTEYKITKMFITGKV